MRRMHLTAATCSVLAASVSLAGFGVARALGAMPATAASAPAAGSATGVRFELNEGQTDGRVNFIVRGAGNPVFITPGEMTVVLTKPPTRSSTPVTTPSAGRRTTTNAPGAGAPHGQVTETVRGAVLRLQLASANPHPQVTGEIPVGGVSNYLRGNDPSKWVRGVRSYAQVRYHDVYPGIDLVYHAGPNGGVEYDFAVAPGADASAIGIDIRGADSVSANGQGGLLVSSAGGELTEAAPQIYQDGGGGKRTSVSGGYAKKAPNRIGFAVGTHDSGKPVVIDPQLSWSTLLGGATGNDSHGQPGAGIVVDAGGSPYVAGDTFAVDFPTTTGAFQKTYDVNPNRINGITPGLYSNVFVTKMTPDGAGIVWSTYLGGSGGSGDFSGDVATGIALDRSGNVDVVGNAQSPDFPTTPNAFEQTLSSQSGFISRLSPDGSTLEYSSFLYGSSTDSFIGGVAVDASGKVYVTGVAEFGSAFPTTANAYQSSCNRCPTGGDGVSVSGSTTYVSASGHFDARDLGRSITGTNIPANAVIATVVNASTITLSAAATASGSSLAYSVPVPARWAFTHMPFMAEIDPSQSGASSLAYSTLIADNVDFGNGGEAIAVDGSGDVYVAGNTTAAAFPTTSGSYQPACLVNCVLYGDGSATVGSTTFTSQTARFTASDVGVSIASNVLPAGTTVAAVVDAQTITLSAAAISTAAGQQFFINRGGFWPRDPQMGFVAKFDPRVPGAAGLVYSTLLGGSGGDDADAIAVDGAGNAYVAGNTGSTDFPTTAGALQRTCSGNVANPCQDGFVAKLNPSGSALGYSTYLGAGSATVSRLAVDGASPPRAYVAGATSSGFPTKDPIAQFEAGTTSAGFVSELAGDGSAFVWSTTLGGFCSAADNVGDSVDGIDVDAGGSAYLTGNACSNDFPTTPGAFQTVSSGGQVAFVAKLSPVPASAPVVSSVNPAKGALAGGTTVALTGHGLTGATGVLFGSVPATSFSVSSDTSMTAVSPPQASYGTVRVVVQTPGGTSAPNPIDAFAYTDGFWTPTGALLLGRDNATATLLRNGKVLVAGGLDTNHNRLAECELYDPVAGTWSVTGSLNDGRFAHAATLLNDGRVLAMGGDDSVGITNTAEIYDPATGAWTTVAPLNVGRDTLTATTLQSGLVLVVGGNNGSGAEPTVEIYDPGANTWTVPGFLSQPPGSTSPQGQGVYAHTATLLPSGQVLVVGGIGSPNSVSQSAAYLFDPIRRSFSPTGSMGSPRSAHTATLLPDGKVLVTGGANAFDSFALSSEELYDPATGTWSLAGTTVYNRVEHAAALLPSGKVLLVGGMDVIVNHNEQSVRPAELYDGSATPTNTVTDSVVTDHSFHFPVPVPGDPLFTSTVLSQAPCGTRCGTVLVAGGEASSSAEIYTPPPAVTSISPSSGPIAGGTSVTISGVGFTNGAARVTFGGVSAANVTVNSYARITAVAPPAAAGSVDVVVSSDGGSSTPTLADRFTYAAPPPPPPPPGVGYWLVASDGGIFPFGDVSGFGSTGAIKLNKPIVGMAATPDGRGYWLVASDGGIFPFGDAGGYGSTGAIKLNKPVVGMAATPDGRGYWLVASDGGIFPFGDAAGYGSTGAITLNKPVVGMAATPDGRGYWLVASDGGIFPFGDAAGYGSTGAIVLNKPMVGMAATSDGRGYWLVASDGGIFPFGDAAGKGSTGAVRLNKPMVGMAATRDGGGYWLVASDGGIFPFGDAQGAGSTGGMTLNAPIVGMAARTS